MPTTVVNKNRPHDVYIGRPSSKWGNPFSHLFYGAGTKKVYSREEAIRYYEEWIKGKPELIAEAKRELRGKVLGCWCKPFPCHGDILAKIADED